MTSNAVTNRSGDGRAIRGRNAEVAGQDHRFPARHILHREAAFKREIPAQGWLGGQQVGRLPHQS